MINFSNWTFLSLLVLTLGCHHDPSVELLAQLKHSNAETRLVAVKALAELSDPKVLPALANTLNDVDADVRREAIHALRQFGKQAALYIPQLESAIEDTNLSIKLNAALAIESIDPSSKAYVSTLTQALIDGQGGIFLEIGQMSGGAEWAVPTLVRLLSDRRPQIRKLSAITLGQIGTQSEAALKSLRRTLQDPDKTVRSAAQKAIEQIETPSNAESSPGVLPL